MVNLSICQSLRDGGIPSLRFSDYNNDCQMERVDYHTALRFNEIIMNILIQHYIKMNTF